MIFKQIIPKIRSASPARAGLVAFFMLLSFTVALFHAVLLERRVFYYGDFDKFFYPAKLLVAQALAQGRLPLWDPTIMGGIPVMAHPLYSAAYPPSFIFAFLPFHMGLGVFFSLHYVLTGLFTYYLLKEWKVSSASALIAALSYAFGGMMVSSASLPPVLQTMTWLPFLALSFQRAISRRSGVYLSLSGVALSLMFYGGEIHLAYVALMVLFFWAAAETRQNIRKKVNSPGVQWPPMGFGIIALIGLLLSLPLLLSAGMFTSLSNRASGLSLEEASGFSLRPGGLVGLLSPSLLFDRQSYTSWYEVTGVYRTAYFLSLYAGAIPLVLSLVGMAAVRMKIKCALLVLLLLSLTAAMGKNAPLFSLIHHYVPFMNTFRYPEKYLAFSSFFLAIFAGFGAEVVLRSFHIIQTKGERPGGPFQAEAMGISLNSCPVKAMEGGADVRLSTGMLLKWLLPWVIAAGFVSAYGLGYEGRFAWFLRFINVFGVQLSGEAESYGVYQRSVAMDFMKFGFLVMALMLFSVFFNKIGRGRALPGIFIVALTALDLFTAHYRLNPTVTEGYYLEKPEIVSYLATEKEPYRIHSVIFEKKRGELPISFPSTDSINLWEKEALKHNMGSIYGLQDTDGESALRLGAQQNFINLIRRAPPEQRGKLLAMFNVKYLLAFRSQEEELSLRHSGYLELVKRFDKSGILLYRNKNYLPRVYGVSSARVVGSEREALVALMREDFDPFREVILMEKRPPGRPQKSKNGGDAYSGRTEFAQALPEMVASIELLEYGDSAISVAANFAREGFLVLSDAYYPEWMVTLDGEPGELLQANYLFRAVKLSQGAHIVRFSYKPYAFARGAYTGLSMASLVVALILVFHFSARRRAGTAAKNKSQAANDTP